MLSYEGDKDKARENEGERKDEVNSSVNLEESLKSEGVGPEEGQREKVAIEEGENVYRSEQSQGQQGVAGGHGLPSSMESRRSQWSRQFTTMMDNLQSNIFVAGQRLNDLTGYSAIETLKRDIHAQGTDIPCSKKKVTNPITRGPPPRRSPPRP